MAELAAVGTASQVNYVEETTYGVTPTTPTMKIVRATIGTKFDLKKDTFQSKEMSSKRQVLGMTYGVKSGSGSFPFELSYGSFDDFLSAAMGEVQAWQTNVAKIGNTKRSFTMEQNWPDINVNEINTGVVITGFDLSVKPNAIVTGNFNFMFKDQASVQTVADVTATGAITFGTTATIVRTSGSWTADGFANGDVIEISGANTSANNKRTTIVTAGTTTMTVTTAAVTIDATDNTALKVSKVLSTSAASAINTNPVFDSFSGLATEGGATIAIITGLDLKLDQSSSASNVLFSSTAQQITLSTVNVTGTLTVRFINNQLKKKFLNGTVSDISFTLGATTNQKYTFDMSGVKYMSTSTDSSEGELTQQLSFQAIYDSGDASSLKVTRAVA